MNLQPSTNQKVFVIIIGLVLLIGVFVGASQLVGKEHSDKQGACMRAQQYHDTHTDMSSVETLDDTLCGAYVAPDGQ